VLTDAVIFMSVISEGPLTTVTWLADSWKLMVMVLVEKLLTKRLAHVSANYNNVCHAV
jgi:hypothetical protein